jgi:hypothetical protein
MLSPSDHNDKNLDPASRIAKAWDDAMKVRGVTRPSEMKGIETVGMLLWLSEHIAPSRLRVDWMQKRMGEEKVKALKEKTKEELKIWLEAMM